MEEFEIIWSSKVAHTDWEVVPAIPMQCHHWNLAKWFPGESGVQQGCISSPIFFLVIINWIMWKTTSDKPRNMKWTNFSQLEDLDFVNSPAVLSSNNDHLEEKHTVCINSTPEAPITVNGDPLYYLSSPLHTIHNGCLRNICYIFWPEKISNKELYKQTNRHSVVLDIKYRCFHWLGDILRTGRDCIQKVALGWTVKLKQMGLT